MLETLQISDGKSQAVFVFVLLVLMKKSIIVVLGMAASVVPLLNFAPLTLIFIFPSISCSSVVLLFIPSRSISQPFMVVKLEGTKDLKGIIWDMLVDEKLNMTWQSLAAQKANSILDSVKGSVASREGR